MSYSFTLNNGVCFPAVGFGTYRTQEGGPQVIETAVRCGYRYFDTASYYGNEEMVGRALSQSGLPRDEFFLASKVWKTEMSFRQTREAFYASLNRLGTDYLDLYLIHWPRPDLTSDWKQLDLDTWKVLEELYAAGKVRAIGVSNFLPHHLENILEHCQVKPAVNQVELHPGYCQTAVRDLCRQQNILVQAWSPMGRARLLDDPVICRLAAQYGVSPAQICLRFLLQLGVMPLPKASSEERMRQNLDLFSFSLASSDLKALLSIPCTGWSHLDPDAV